MGIEWFRDLSITILGFVTSAVLIFVAVLAYRTYRDTRTALRQVKAASKKTMDTAATMQKGIELVLPVLPLIQGIRGGITGIGKLFTKRKL